MDKPVEEEEIKVKVINYGDDVPGCKSHHHHLQPKNKDTAEDESVIKQNYISRLSAKYSRYSLSRRPEKPARKEGFSHIREECLQRKTLFCDDSFRPSVQSIGYSGSIERDYEWKRPGEFVRKPEFFVEGATRFDIQQGELGDCWLLAAVSTLTLNPKLFHFVVPCDQGFDYKYAGIFHFKFWQYGEWVDVYIDDLLPTHGDRLVFMHSKTPQEFWCALLEKAYAKFYGCYEALKGGNISEAMVDLTGGVVQMIELNENPQNLFSIIKKAYKRNAMMGCGINCDDVICSPEERLTNGLITGHAYSITKVTSLQMHKGPQVLIRLHNPWGNEAEWTGPWSDQSEEWNSISISRKIEMGLTFDDDGEFWMPFSDFRSIFTFVDICDVTPEVLSKAIDDDDLDEEYSNPEPKNPLKMRLHTGEWATGSSAGGCRNFLETFAENPQFVVLLDDPEDPSDGCNLVVSLMQKNVRRMKKFGAEFVSIGFSIYRLPPGRVPGRQLDEEFFKQNKSAGRTPFFVNSREVSRNFKLPVGVYVVIPSTFRPNCDGKFLLRVYTETQTRFKSRFDVNRRIALESKKILH